MTMAGGEIYHVKLNSVSSGWTHIHSLSRAVWTASLTTANSGLRLNKIVFKRRGCTRGGFYHFSSPGPCKCKFSAHERGSQSGCALGGETPTSLAILPAHLSLSAFLCSRPDPSVQGVCKEDKHIFSLVAWIGDFSLGQDRWEGSWSSHPGHVMLLFEKRHPGPVMLDKGHQKVTILQGPYQFPTNCLALSIPSLRGHFACSLAQVCGLPAGWVPAWGPDLAFCNWSFYLKATLGKSMVLTPAALWRQ